MVAKFGVVVVLGAVAGLTVPLQTQAIDDCPDEICVQPPCEWYWDYINNKWLEICDHSLPCAQAQDMKCSPGSGSNYPCLQVWCPIFS